MSGHSIFISYRRFNAGGHGRALHEYLSKRFGDDRVFFDRNTIESGDAFPHKLRQGVEGCAVLLALIGPEWLDIRDRDGGRRLDDAHDFVRREIALALERGKKVIPVLFDDTPFPSRDRLPDPLKALADCDALQLRGKAYEYETQRRELVRLLEKVPGVPQPFPEAGEAIAAIPAGLLPPVKVLIIFANPRGTDAIRLGAEDRAIHESINLGRYRASVHVTPRHAATVHDLRRALLNDRFQIVHISGHGTGAGLILEDETGELKVVPQLALAGLFSRYSPPINCVILNACYSISQGKLLAMGVPFTIAMEGPLSDDAAIEFSRGFYDAIVAGHGVEFAYKEGCNAVALATPDATFMSRILRQGEMYDSDRKDPKTPVPSRSLGHFNDTSALIGLVIDLSGSMAESLNNDTGIQLSRLESLRRSLGQLAQEAKMLVHESHDKRLGTSIDIFAYGLGLRINPYCDLLSLIKAGHNIMTQEEVDRLKVQYARDMQIAYRKYEGLGDLASQWLGQPVIDDIKQIF